MSAVAVVLLFTLSACSQDDNAGDRDGFSIADLPFAGEFDHASDYQKALVEDGTLTFQEYEAAIAATVGCLKDIGFIVAEDAMKLNSRSQYTYSATLPDQDQERLMTEADECTNRFARPTAGAWEWFTRPTEQEIAAGRAALAACLAEANVDVGSDPASQEFAQIAASGNQDYQRCIVQVQEEYALPNFGG